MSWTVTYPSRPRRATMESSSPRRARSTSMPPRSPAPRPRLPRAVAPHRDMAPLERAAVVAGRDGGTHNEDEIARRTDELAPTTMTALEHDLELRGVTKRFGSFVAVNDVSLVVEKGQFVCLLGPSGCGKTTTLRLIAGLEEADAGEIRIAGVRVDDMPPWRRDIAMMFQDFALFPHMTVARQVGFGLEMLRRPKEEIRRRVGEVLDAFEIAGLQPARGGDAGAEGRAASRRHLIRVGDARPERGFFAGRSGGGDEPRPNRAGGGAGRDLRVPADQVRRDVHPGPQRLRRRGRACRRDGRRRRHVRRALRGAAPQRAGTRAGRG